LASVEICPLSGEMTPRRNGVFVDAAGLLYCTDYNAGLYIIEFGG
jgi:hypothetical protein